MSSSIRTTALSIIQRQLSRFFSPVSPQLSVGFPLDGSSFEGECNNALEESLWFAVPKSKVSRGKKRMKTTLQKQVKMKNNIVIDKRTGELTLKHKLPYNWKNYLPENAEYAP